MILLPFFSRCFGTQLLRCAEPAFCSIIFLVMFCKVYYMLNLALLQALFRAGWQNIRKMSPREWGYLQLFSEKEVIYFAEIRRNFYDAADFS